MVTRLRQAKSPDGCDGDDPSGRESAVRALRRGRLREAMTGRSSDGALDYIPTHRCRPSRKCRRRLHLRGSAITRFSPRWAAAEWALCTEPGIDASTVWSPSR